MIDTCISLATEISSSEKTIAFPQHVMLCISMLYWCTCWCGENIVRLYRGAYLTSTSTLDGLKATVILNMTGKALYLKLHCKGGEVKGLVH